MLYRSYSCALLVSLSLTTVLSASVATVRDLSSVIQPHHADDEPTNLSAPNIHSHSLHAPEPLLELNETDILRWHASDPMSYWSHDFDSDDGVKNWRGFMGIHVFGMCLAFFVLLPIDISLRSVRHRWHSAAILAFNVVVAVSLAAGSLYKKLTGDLYDGSVHGRGGFLVLTLVTILATCDALAFLQRALAFFRGPDKKNIRVLWQSVVLNQPDHLSPEYRLVHEEPDEYAQTKLIQANGVRKESQHKYFTGTIDTSRGPSFEWANEDDWPQFAASHRTVINHPLHRHQRSVSSSRSEETLHNPSSSSRANFDDSGHSYERRSCLSSVGRIAFATAERLLVLLGFVELLSGITVYTGICRQSYINGCMAHLIKGGIFWCYGLLTFGRYLGAWADLGWAWNRLPPHRAHKVPSAEAVESFVIFVYGATNIWMERFGAEPGSPFTTKQIQHISIAVMFLFAGILGLTLESKTFRRWLSSPAESVVKPDEHVSQPPSYAGSFNPFPALVISVTGAAMSAHHQAYVFQVQIHALWGFFLTGFAVFRCLTYFFLWIRPPLSVLPSRPPSEAMASFFLASGGLVFILSTEQITFAFMRRQMDDVMFLFNLAVAVTCLAFSWVMSITAFKGWVAQRSRTPFPASLIREGLYDEHVA